jgi:DNA-binding CsgD family transcriptional regulator
METATGRRALFSVHEWAELKQDLSLSPRQADVVEQLLSGHSDKQIAHELQMSVPTVRTHLCRLFSRFGVDDRCELIVHVYSRFREKCQAYGCPRARETGLAACPHEERALSCIPSPV